MGNYKLARLATALSLTLGAVWFAGSGAEAAPAEAQSPGSDLTLIRNQEVLLANVDKIESRFQKSPIFGSVAIDPEANEIVVYQVGGDSNGETQAAAAAEVPGVNVVVRDAALSAADVSEVRDAVNSSLDAIAKSGVVLTHWGLEEPGGRYQIAYDPTGKPLDPKLLQSVFRTDATHSLLDSGKIVATLDGGEALSRTADSSPYYGGSLIQGYTDSDGYHSKCSSGFPTKSAGGVLYLVTAWHCTRSSGTAITTDFFTKWVASGKIKIGDSHSINAGADMAFIQVTNGTLDHRIFDGPIGNTTQSKAVVGHVGPTAGQLICTSGSVSYARCTGAVQAASDWYVPNDYTNFNQHVYGWWASSSSEQAAVGDSGGPVFVNVNSNTQAKALGIISYGTGAIACPSGVVSSACYKNVYFGLAQTANTVNKLSFTW